MRNVPESRLNASSDYKDELNDFHHSIKIKADEIF